MPPCCRYGPVLGGAARVLSGARVTDACPECDRLFHAYARARHEYQTMRNRAMVTRAGTADETVAIAREVQDAEVRRDEASAALAAHMKREHRNTKKPIE